MPRDPLTIMLRLRRAAEDEAKRAFAARLAEEATARARVEAAQADMAREHDHATRLDGDDRTVEAYVKWLPIGLKHTHTAQVLHERANTNVTLARAALNLAHAAAEAAETLIERQAEAARTVAARKAQAELDEVAARSTEPLP